MRSGDQITSFNGQRIAVVADFIKQLAATTSDRAGVEVNRGNQTRQLEIEVPGDEEARTALRPTLPNPNATSPAPPQQLDRGLQGVPGTPPAPPTQPRFNPPRR
jgi:hypothetical protein